MYDLITEHVKPMHNIYHVHINFCIKKKINALLTVFLFQDVILREKVDVIVSEWMVGSCCLEKFDKL